MRPIQTECTTLWLSWFTVEGNGRGPRRQEAGGGQCSQDIPEPLRGGPARDSVPPVLSDLDEFISE